MPVEGPVAIRCPVWGLSFSLPGRAGASPFAGQVSAECIRLVRFCEILVRLVRFCEILVTGAGFGSIGLVLRL